jgi:hypothetical protein
MDDVHLSGAAILVITALMGALAGTITFLFKLLLKSKDDQYADIRAERDNYRQMATEAINMLEETVNLSRQYNNQPIYVPPRQLDDQQTKTIAELKNRFQKVAIQLPITPNEVKQISPKKIGF